MSIVGYICKRCLEHNSQNERCIKCEFDKFEIISCETSQEYLKACIRMDKELISNPYYDEQYHKTKGTFKTYRFLICRRCLAENDEKSKKCRRCGFRKFEPVSYDICMNSCMLTKSQKENLRFVESLKSNPDFDEKLYNKLNAQGSQAFGKQCQDMQKRIEKREHPAKCPTCGSTNIKDISTLNRAVSVGMFGLASSKIGKTKECKDCGYKW